MYANGPCNESWISSVFPYFVHKSVCPLQLLWLILLMRRGRPPCLPVVFVFHLPLFAVVVIPLSCVRLLRRADTGVCPYGWMRLLGGQTQESAPMVGCGCWAGRHRSLPLHVDPFVCLFHCFHSSILLLLCFQSNTPVIRENWVHFAISVNLFSKLSYFIQQINLIYSVK